MEAIAAYIEQDSPAYARSVLRKIVACTRNLAEFPDSGRKVPEFDDEQLREVLAYSYRIIYRVQTREVIVAAVVHGRRDLSR